MTRFSLAFAACSLCVCLGCGQASVHTKSPVAAPGEPGWQEALDEENEVLARADAAERQFAQRP